MKKLIALLMILALCISLLAFTVSCNEPEEPDNGQQTPGEDDGTDDGTGDGIDDGTGDGTDDGSGDNREEPDDSLRGPWFGID